MNKIQIRFDGPPEHEAGRFVEVENDTGASISIGEWVQDGDYWLLVIDDPRPLRARIVTLESQLEQARALLWVWTDMDPLRYDSEYSACPFCAVDDANRHESDCAFVQARVFLGIEGGARMLTRDELERRLKRWSGVKPDDPSYLRDSGQREALQTALTAMDERDEILIAKERDSQMAVSYYSKYQEAIAERDALLAENRLLRDSLALVDDIDGWHLASNVRIALESAFLPRTAAEVERVRLLEAVLEAAEAQDPPASANLARALAAYHEGKRPGGEV